MSALVAAGIVMAFAIANWAQPGSPEAVPRFFNVTLPDSAPLVPARDPWDVATRALAISGDGRSVVYSTGQGGSVHLMLTRLDAGTTMPLPGTDSAGLPVFSPDGRSIAFRTTAQIRRVSLEDGSVTKIGDGGATGLAWSEDGHIYGRGEACLWSMPAAGGPLKRVAPNTKCLGGRMGPMQAAKLLLFDANGIMYALDTEREVIRPLRGPATAGTANGAGGSEAFGHSPFLVSPGVLAFLRNSTVYAARFDVRELRLMSEPVAVLENVRSEAYGAHLGLADDGTLVWVSGSDATRGKFVWVTRGGAIGDSLFLPREHMRSFALTSDGRRLAYNTTSPTDGNVLYVVSIDTKVIDVARTDVALDPLDWIDGDQRLLVQLHRRDATSRIAVVAWKQGNVVVDTSEAEFDGQSADGTQRCWGRRRNFLDIWKTATPTSRVQLPWGGAWCRFSPDGRRVAWIFGKSLYVASTDSAAARTRVQLAGDGADEPRWSADGKSIYFRNANRWYVVAVPSPDGKVQPPRLLFQGHFLQAYASWALGPDGRFLTLIGPEEPPARNLRVMTHFPEFVRRKLGVAD